MLSILVTGNNLPFTFVMTVLFLVALWGLLSKNAGSIAKGFSKSASGLLTSIGIFGTFFGIVLALLDFSSDNIREHIDNIINGMQTAFITSVVGVFLSLVLKVTGIFVESKNKDNPEDGDIDGEELISKFIAQSNHTAALVEKMDVLVRSIGSDSDSSMLGQLRLLRSDNSDNTKRSQEQFKKFEEKLEVQLDKFAEMLSRSATEQIIEALRQVIADFNNKISEQFGENFKHLNHAVGELLQWQENYKQQLLEMSKQYEHGVQAITQTSQVVSEIEKSTQAIPVTMQQLDDAIQSNQNQISHLNGYLGSFAELRDKAVAALPEIKQQIGLMLVGMNSGSQLLQNAVSKAAEDFSSHTREAFSEMVKATESLREYSQEIGKELENASRAFIRNIEKGQNDFSLSLVEIQKEFSTKLQEVVAEQARTNSGILRGMSDEAEKALERTGESMQKQIEAMDTAMQKEVERVMTAMGSALVTISNTFVQDYRKLVDEMNRIVRYGRNEGR